MVIIKAGLVFLKPYKQPLERGRVCISEVTASAYVLTSVADLVSTSKTFATSLDCIVLASLHITVPNGTLK